MRFVQRKSGQLMAYVLASVVAATAVLSLTAGPAAAGAAGDSTVMQFGPQQTQEAAHYLADGLQRFQAAFVKDSSSAGSAAVSQVRTEVTAGRLMLHLPYGAGAVASEAYVWVSPKTGERLVFVPYAGTVVKPSGLTVGFDARGSISAYSESVYQSKGETAGTVAVWSNGVLKGQVLVDASGTAVPDVESAPAATVVTPASWWDDFTYCLSNIMNVPDWALHAIEIACGFACFFTAGAGCLACLTGAAFGYLFEVSFCIGWASG